MAVRNKLSLDKDKELKHASLSTAHTSGQDEVCYIMLKYISDGDYFASRTILLTVHGVNVQTRPLPG